VPFVAMARARGWRRQKTFGITAACGAGHLIASLSLGAVGVAAGLALSDVDRLQAGRGRLAGWLLIGFGLAYLAWGIKRAIGRRPHTHWHTHGDGTLHRHQHVHAGQHLHTHDANAGSHHHHGKHGRTRSITPWVLFTIFLFGPCEPLIPLLMVPAASGNWFQVALVAAIFSAATLTAMLSAVAIGLAGVKRFHFAGLERYSDALAGAAVTACGLLVNYGF
jgi:ABC-type nickel/cobalt efflux system permease component RcnA